MHYLKKLVLLNGPPKCGKDTISNRLIRVFENSENVKLSSPLKDSLPQFFGLTQEEVNYLEAHKEEPSPLLLGKTWRQSQISLSEDWSKVFFNERVFGEILVNKISKSENQLFFVSDSGFYSEAKPLVEKFGESNILLLRIFRPGCNFSNDSRSYWEHDFNIKSTNIFNDSSIDRVVEYSTREIKGWLKHEKNSL